MNRLFLIIPVSVCLAFPACKKVHGPANDKSVQQNNNLDSLVAVDARVNGRLWHADTAYGYFVRYSGNDTGLKSLLISATQKLNDSLTTITFNISNYTGPNTYVIDPPVNTAAYYMGNFRNFALTGTIKISSDTAYALIGTFSFTADTFTITNGEFNVALP